MSGGMIAYNLRPNKAVERHLFIDLLGRINAYANISDYSYFSLGGPFLEDIKLVHAALRVSKLTCIEADAEVIKRQRFNAPLSGLVFTQSDVNQFLAGFFPTEPCIVWLDYASVRQINNQLTELLSLLRKLAPGDIFKITLNANPDALGEKRDGEAPEDVWARRREMFRARVQGFVPADIVSQDMRASRYPGLLMRCLRRVVEMARVPPGVVVQPLASFVYADTHQMLTFTGIVLREDEVEAFFAKTRLRHWAFANLDWAAMPRMIAVPALSLRERLLLEAQMPKASVDELAATLGYQLADDEHLTKQMLESFRDYYRMLPQYSRVVL